MPALSAGQSKVQSGLTDVTRGSYKVSEDTRRRLLEAAGELFACHGLEATTVRDITARAGTKPNAVSYHFGGKDGLVDAVWDYCLRRWRENRLTRYLSENEMEQTYANALQVLQEVSKLEEAQPLTQLILSRFAQLCNGATIADLCATADSTKGASLEGIV